RAHARGRPGVGPGIVAGWAGLARRDRQRHLCACQRLVEEERHLSREVAAPRAAAAADASRPTPGTATRRGAAEDVGEDVAETARHRARVEAARHAEAAKRTRAAVVLLALLRVAE